MPQVIERLEDVIRIDVAPTEDWCEKCDLAGDKWEWRARGDPLPPACELQGKPPFIVRNADAREPWKSLPTALWRIRDSILRSREMLDLPDDWDEDGAKQIGEDTWRRAAAFLTRYAERVWDRSGRVLDPPDITPSVDGSVDIHWDKPGYELLIAIPPDGGAMASFYGDNRGRGFIKGEFDVNDLNEGLIEWLTKA